jgi:ribosomal protein S18 acetylase RimI-like enzyme
LLTRLGFEEYRVWDDIMKRSLSESFPESRLPDDFTIRSATMDDYEQLAAVRNASFGLDWTAELYRDQVMRKPGYWPAREIVAAAPDGRVAAFTVIRLDAVNRIGQFEPVGTHPDFQRQGLARALMLHALRVMQRQGMQTATVGHDATNVAARELYRSLGFWKKYETLGYRRFSRDQGAGVRDQES